ncbi:MAG: TetR family transcriptional regulator, partial [Bacteroidales bacterium]|nr:TetR family transcriptional regulator [Bacteroidales bacterium]
ANEDAPFIHPNKKLLFFTTDGHRGMGGNDIYKTELIYGEWAIPKNMGYPINSTANDNYFTLIADGSKGYFSSDRKGGLGGQDIYMMDMPENYETIPLTMIKGRILNTETNQPISTNIYIVDRDSKEKVDYVYHPNEKTGDYLVILPPNKSYDMIVESEGFLPYTLNIEVPNQTEFYELYQKINLKTIKHFDVVVGQEVEIKNAFYKTHEESSQDVRKEYEAALIAHDSIDVYELMGDLIEAADQAGIDYSVELLMMENPIDGVDFNDSNEKIQTAKRIYYYDESDESKFDKKIVGDIIIYSLPTMFVSKEAKEQKNMTEKTSTNYNKHLLNKGLKIYFNAGVSNLNNKYEKDLDLIMKNIKHQNTEEKILDAAKEVFTEEGKAGAKMQMIADRAGINKSLLHYYYRSKDKLFAAVFKFAFGKMASRIFDIFKSDDDFFTQIEKFIENYLSAIIKNPFIPMFILGELNKKHNNIAAELIIKSGVNIDFFEDIVNEQIKKGNIRETNPKKLIINILALCVFPVIAKPLIEHIIFDNDKNAYNEYIKNRKDEITQILFSQIKP